MAKIFLELKRYQEANSSLEQALSHSFEVRESPLFFLLRAQCHEKQGEWKEALSVLQSAFNLPGVSKPMPAGAASGRSKAKGPTPEERAQIFIHLATVHNELGQTPEATKIIVEAKREFHGTPSHAQIIIVDADLALRRGDVHAALKLLQGVGPDSAHYIKARVAAANIHLTHRHDKKNFIRYFVELVEKNKESIAMHCMLAEAYMRLQEPDKAVLSYQDARKLEERQGGDRGDSDLAGKIGQAFISSHDFEVLACFSMAPVCPYICRVSVRLSCACVLYVVVFQAADKGPRCPHPAPCRGPSST